MDYEVVVVGGGIGGLTVAALLAQRGVSVCLLERESKVGGCAASFEKFGYSFEQGDGLYAAWQFDEIHDRIFSELPVAAPEVHLLEPSYGARLPDGLEIAVSGNKEQFEESLSKTFPECAAAAISFYRGVSEAGGILRRAFRKAPDLLSASKWRRAYTLVSEGKTGAQILAQRQQTTLQHLEGSSPRFRRFIDLQLQTLAQGSAAQVGYLDAALALTEPAEGMYAIRGGASTLAETLADSIRRSGGKIRLDTPVLRLAYDTSGSAIGVDLLSGETVTGSKAIVSNLTLWDTYGKLVGLNRTPVEIRKQLKELRGWGAYLIYLSFEENPAATLVSDHILALTDWEEKGEYDPELNQLVFAAAPKWDPRAPAGKRAVTVHFFTDVDEWFTFHKDQTELEEKDQQMLELCWSRLHVAMPELGSNVEVIDTATPRTFYDLTRRKLGLVGALSQGEAFWQNPPSYQTSLSNLFVVSDTVTPGGISGLTRSALVLANKLTT